MKKTVLSHSLDGGWSAPLPDIDSPETLVLVFGAPEYRDDVSALRELAEAFPGSHLIGCSTAGEVFGSQIRDRSLAVAALRFEQTRLECASAPVASQADSHAAGHKIAERLLDDDLRAVFVLSDGLHVNGTALSAGLNSVLPPSVVVTGGLAGDGSRFESTWTLAGGELEDNRVVAVGMYGDALQVGHGSRGGWDIFGPERIVTRAEGSVLYELDGRPALDLYKEYLGELAAGLPATGLLFPLALRADGSSEEQLVRTILAVDEANAAMVFAGDIPVGHRAQLMQANFERLVMGAESAAKAALLDASDGLTIAISCVGRRLVLAERAEEEVEAVAEILGPGMDQIGFYSYGEISPFTDGRCDLHNQTMTLTTLGESP